MNAKEFVDSLFEGYEQTQSLADFKEEMLGNLNAKIENLVKNGMEIEAAAAKAFAELGDVAQLADEFSLKKTKGTFLDGAFSCVVLECKADVNIHPGKQQHRAVISGGGDTKDRITTEIRGNALHICEKEKPGFFHRSKPTVDVYLSRLEAVKLMGAGDISVDDYVAENLNVEISGCGDITLGNGSIETLDIGISGKGDITLGEGDIGAVNIRLSGLGDITFGTGDIGTLDIGISGKGDITLGEGDISALDIRLSGCGDITFGNGNVGALTVNLSGMGDVIMGNGNIGTLDANISGMGNIILGNGKVESTKTSVSGIGKIYHAAEGGKK